MKAVTSRRFFGDESGAVAATYALALIPLIAFAGVGFDYARVMGLDSELQNGADQAALAAASQLDGQGEACERAANAASGMLQNLAVLSSESKLVTVASETACDATGQIRFYQDKEKTTAATEDGNANFVEVQVDGRRLDYSLLPIVGAYGADLAGVAFAGVGSAICRVPPLMICSPSEDPNVLFDADSKVGIGVKATGGSSWSPGAFGFLEIGDGQTAELAQALAFDEGRFDCQKIDEGTNPETGNAQILFEAVNTRFDIRDTGNDQTLRPCDTGGCPPARNVTKDLIKEDTTVNGNSCRIGNKGWKLPPLAQRFSPRAYMNGDSSLSMFNASGMPLVMGLTRDMCHYVSYDRDCPQDNGGLNDRFGDGTWAIRDYFARNHGMAPPDANMSRYEVYRWEIDNNNFPGSTNGQRSKPLCVPGTSNIDRRVLTVAIVRNCEKAITVGGVTYEALKGGSRKALIEEWVDMFLVEPVVDDADERANGRDKDMIYMEVIGEAKLGGGSGSPTSQAIRKDVPYLIE